MKKDKKIVVYKLKPDNAIFAEKINYSVSIWKPSLVKIHPPNKSIKYLFYWLFHFFKVFHNEHYSSGLLLDNGKIVSSLLVVPAHFKWPFMGGDDVQFTYVLTNPKYRGKGLAKKTIQHMISELSSSVDTFWYVTDTENKASIKVAEKLGFEFAGYAERSGILRILRMKD
jgi:ribosomal protein S18 acetylase RimI-like enzyme